MANKSVKDKIVLVTGAGAGFGRGIVENLAKGGANVIATDIVFSAAEETAKLCKDLPGRVHAKKHDVSSEQDWDDVLEFVKDQYTYLDGLINNAGYMLTKPYLDTSLDEFKRIQDVNVNSIWVGVQKAHPLLKLAASKSAGGSASVVNVSSVYGQVAGFAQSAYCATKGAVRQLTKCQAIEFARAGDGVRVNSVHPGPGNTALAQNGVQQMLDAGMVATADEAVNFLTSLIPSGRFAEVEDVADLMYFLCSDASRYFTGAEFTLDGGYTAL